MATSKTKIFTTKINFTKVCIYFNGKLFVMFKREQWIGLTSWIEGGGKYCVEFIFKNGKLLVELDSSKYFYAFLQEVDESLARE